MLLRLINIVIFLNLGPILCCQCWKMGRIFSSVLLFIVICDHHHQSFTGEFLNKLSGRLQHLIADEEISISKGRAGRKVLGALNKNGVWGPLIGQSWVINRSLFCLLGRPALT